MALMSRNEGEGAGAPRPPRTLTPIRPPCTRLGASAPLLAAGLAALSLGGCAGSQSAVSSAFAPLAPARTGAMFPESEWGVTASRRVAGTGERIPKGGGVYKVGEPYQVGGRWYNPRQQPEYDRIGIASWYGNDFHGRHTANGEVFDMHALTAAHPTLPLPSYAYVTNLSNNRTILVRINDRGPYVGERMIDLSRESARALGLLGGGTGRVRVRYAGPAPLDGNDSRERQFLASRPWRGSTDIAALERAQSAREWTAAPPSAPPREGPPARREALVLADRPPAGRSHLRDVPAYGEPYGPGAGGAGAAAPQAPASYADASLDGREELWSPETYRRAARMTR